MPKGRRKAQCDGDVTVAFPIRCNRRAFESSCELLPDARVGKAETVRNFLAYVDLQPVGILTPVAVHVERARCRSQYRGHLSTQCLQNLLVITGDAHFNGCFLHGPLLQFAEEHARLGGGLRQLRP